MTAKTTKKAKVTCPNCGANVDAKHAFCPECGKSLKDAKPSKANKNHKFTCLGCDRYPLDKGERFCPGCGRENPGYLPMADAQLKVQKGAPTPGDGVAGMSASSVKPVPAHREPDGSFIESLESDAGMETVPDNSIKAATRFKSIGVTNEMGALHDLLCPAFNPTDANKAHPVSTLNLIDTGVWQAKASDVIFSGTLADAGRATGLWQAAETIKGTDMAILTELRHVAHKEFRDANPGPSTFPTPTEISATRFRRPLITAGHEEPSSGHDGPNTAMVPSSAIEAAQFQRGYLDTGHAADSPSNKNTAILPAPVPTGAAQRTYYRNTQRDAARSAMAAMHDHIAQTFPDLCSMDGPGVGGQPPVGARPVPSPVGKTAKKVKTKKMKTKKSIDDGVVTKAASAVSADVIKSAVLEATGSLVTQIEEISKALVETQQQNKQLAAAIDALGNLPDPNVAAFRGIGFDGLATKSSAAPVGLPSVAETAERQQAALMRALQEQARTSPNPSEREAAWAKLYQMNGLA